MAGDGNSGTERFAQREVRGRDDRGEREVVTLWIERDHAVWRVGRAINIAEREAAKPRTGDYIFEGYELGDALDAANSALDADLEASSDNDDHNVNVTPFEEDELKRRLERWFFDHA